MVIFADIYGTMREYHLGFLPSSAKALDKAKENGHTLILCTGRSVGMIPSDVPLEKFDGMICGGGCYLSYKGEVIRNDFIDDRIMMKYRDWFDRIGAPYALETYEGMFLTPAMSEVVAKGLLRMDSPDADDAPGLRAEKIDPARRVEEFDRRGLHVSKISFCLEPEQYARFDVPDEDGLSLITFNDADDGRVHCEMVGRGCDKGSALVQMTKFIGADISDTLMAGDSMNDADAFRAAGHSLCMGNGNEAMRALADHVTVRCEEDGFYKGLADLGLI